MPVFRILLLFLLGLIGFAAILVMPAAAANVSTRVCLNKAEQAAAVGNGRAIPLSDAVKAARRHGRRGELLRARLCHRGGGLTYVLTLLPRSGKVMRVTVDAANGALITGR